MGSTFQQPINLDPNQDNPQQVSFINQNFQNLASTLESNSFRIAKSGNFTLTPSTIANPGAGNYASDVQVLGGVSHNLGYIPAFIAYLEFSTGARAFLPYQAQDAISASAARWTSYFGDASINSFTVVINRVVFGTGSTSFTADVKYFLLQEPAA